MPHLYFVDSLILTSLEGKSIDLECFLLIWAHNKILNWTWKIDNVKIEASRKFGFIHNEQKSSTLRISDLKIEDSGLYTCLVSNEYGSHTRNITLKVKSHLTILWPFLATLIELILMVFVIGLYELSIKKQQVLQ